MANHSTFEGYIEISGTTPQDVKTISNIILPLFEDSYTFYPEKTIVNDDDIVLRSEYEACYAGNSFGENETILPSLPVSVSLEGHGSGKWTFENNTSSYMETFKKMMSETDIETLRNLSFCVRFVGVDDEPGCDYHNDDVDTFFVHIEHEPIDKVYCL